MPRINAYSADSSVAALLVILWGITCTAFAQDEKLPEQLAKYDPAQQVRFTTLIQAEQRRDALNRFIWPNGLPKTKPQVTAVVQPSELAALQADLIDRTERLDITIGDFDFQATAFRIYPKQVAVPRTNVIVHHGHVPDGAENYLMAGVDDTLEHLLSRGCIVTIMQMPLVGWNQDHTGKLRDGTAFDVGTRGTRGHNELFEALADMVQGEAFAFFLEPVVQAVNLIESEAGKGERVGMIGLSGGGWTTHMAAAVDRRIQFSVPVAGALPLYARPFSRGSRGDAEQQYEPLFREVDRTGDGIPDAADGVASWLEVFALGGVGTPEQPRRQVQALNFYDSCCFSGEVYVTYDQFLTKRVGGLGGGSWSVFIDRTHHDHVISAETLTNALDPLLAH